MRHHPARQEVVLKVVYCGPGLAGKTTNLKFLQARVPPGRASQLVSLDTHSERTLQFDFLAIELGKVQGLDVRLDFYTVPGQSYYAATRRQILAGADGVVFVADSRREALDENIDAMNELLSNIRHHGLPDDLPIVIQYNKQDLPTALSPEQFHPLMNVRGWPSFGAAAINGQGVAETCEALARMMADRLATTILPVVVPSTIDENVPEARRVVAPSSWLITCCRCQSMLDVPSATIGETYTCGVCQSQLEILDPERGLTQIPVAAPQPITGVQRRTDGGADRAQHPRPSAQVEYDLGRTDLGSGGYAATALRPTTGTHSRPGFIAVAGEFPLEGFTVLGTQDENPQGRRLRVREDASHKTYRALVLSPALLAQPGYAESVEPYARMTGPIRHPNLLPLASFRIAPDAIVLLSGDPTDCEPLSHVLARRRALAPPHAIGILRQIALALEEASRHGAIHGWLRPDVILVSADGTVKVDEICVPPNPRYLLRELSGVSAATEYYLAPEYLDDGVRGDIRGDIFLLGALLFRMLTGDGLVTGYNAIEALHKLSANGPRSLRDVQQGVSRELNAFFLKLAAVDRSERFQTYRELIDALDRFGGGARRQTLQLTAPQSRPPGTPGMGTGSLSGARRNGLGSGSLSGARRGGTGALPPAPLPRPVREPSGGHPLLPPPPAAPVRRKRSNGDLFLVAVAVMLLFFGLMVVVILARPRVQPVESGGVTEAPPPAMAPRPEPAPAPAPAPAPSVAPVATSVTPAPAKPAESTAPTVDSAKLQYELRRILGDQLIAEQYAEALKTVSKFSDPAAQRESQANVLARHDERKRELEAMLRPGVNPESIRKLLIPAHTAWGLPGDVQWAVAVQSRADTQALTDQPVPQAPLEVAPVAEVVEQSPKPKPQPDGDWGPTPPSPLIDPGVKAASAAGGAKAPPVPVAQRDLSPVADADVKAYVAVTRATLANQEEQIQAALSTLPAGSPIQIALRQLVTWWPARVDLINRVAGTKVTHLSFIHPATNELVDVTAANERGMTVAVAAGGTSTISWGQVPNASLSKLLTDAASVGGASASDLGGAIAAQFVLDSPDMAVVIALRNKNVLGEGAKVVETLRNLSGRRIVAELLNKGFEAARAGDYRAASAALSEARKQNKDWLATFEADIARLETATVPPPAATGTPITAGQTYSRLPPKDLKDRQAALRTLGWEPINNAWLDGTEVQLLPNGGISFEMNKTITGFSFTIKGDGYLRIIPARGTASLNSITGIPLPLIAGKPATFTVNFTRDAMTVLDARGILIQSLPLSVPPTTFVLISTAEAVFSSVPKPIIP